MRQLRLSEARALAGLVRMKRRGVMVTSSREMLPVGGGVIATAAAPAPPRVKCDISSAPSGMEAMAEGWRR